MSEWKPIATAPNRRVVETKIDDEKGARNKQELKRINNLWFLPDGSMHVYMPTHWRETPGEGWESNREHIGETPAREENKW